MINVKELITLNNEKREALNEENSRYYDDMLMRSEEHTSELQSRGHLVCRLLLEKTHRTPRLSFFPYTTLFRSEDGEAALVHFTNHWETIKGPVDRILKGEE